MKIFKLNRFLCKLTIIFCFTCFKATAGDISTEVLPTPQNILSSWRTIKINSNSVTIKTAVNAVKSAKLASKLLEEKFKKIKTVSANTPKVNIILGQIDSPVFKSYNIKSGIRNKAQAYSIRVIKENSGNYTILMAGTDNQGVFFAATTLLQLIGEDNLKCADIDDYPVWKYRYQADYFPVAGEHLVERIALFKGNGYVIQVRDGWKSFGHGIKPKFGNFKDWDSGLKSIKNFNSEYGQLIRLMLFYNIYQGEGKDERSFDIASSEHLQSLIERCEFAAKNGVDHLVISVEDAMPIHSGKYVFVSEAEKKKFKSVGQAHGYLMKRLYNSLHSKFPALKWSFCPPAYSLDQHNADKEPSKSYLNDLTAEMPSQIYLIWTGPRVVSMEITKKDFYRYSKLIRGRKFWTFNNPYFLPKTTPIIGCIKGLTMYRGFEKATDGLFFANSHLMVSRNMLMALCYADYMWNPCKFNYENSFANACNKYFGITNYEAIRKLLELLQNPQITKGSRAQKAVLWKEVKKLLPDLKKQGFPCEYMQSYIDDILPLLTAEMPSAVVPEFSPRPNIDGFLNDEAWDKAAEIVLKNSTKGNQTLIRLVHDSDAIYLGITAESANGITMPPAKKRDSDLKSGPDTVELYFNADGSKRYWRFGFDAAGNREDFRLWDGGAYWNPEWTIKTQATRNSWTAEIRIPVENVMWRSKLKKGDKWTAQFIRRIKGASKIQAWSMPDNKDNIKAEAFGKIIFRR